MEGNEKLNKCSCSFIYYRIKIRDEKKFLICLKIYTQDFDDDFLTVPNKIILMFDNTSEDSFEDLSNYYLGLIGNKKLEKVKYSLIGNKEDIRVEKMKLNQEFMEKAKNLETKIDNFCKDNKIELYKNISSLTGDGVIAFFDEIVKILYGDVTNMEKNVKESEKNLSNYKNIEAALNFNRSDSQYHNKEYQKEIIKINNKKCCLLCNIF
jgi:GTPase SAR1 family protein